MRSLCEHQVAVAKYHKRVLIAGMVAAGVFIATLWAVSAVLELYRANLRAALNSPPYSAVPQIIVPLTLFSICSLPALAILYLAVSRARKQPGLHCVKCAGELFSSDSTYFTWLLAACPHCGTQLIGITPQPVDAAYFQRASTRLVQEQKFTVSAVCFSCPVMYVILVWGKQVGAFPNANWAMIMGFPIFFSILFLGPFCIAVSLSMARLRRASAAWECANNSTQDWAL